MHNTSQQYPPITTAPSHRCGLGPTPPVQLALDELLQSDISALTIWDVLLDGEQVHSPLASPLAKFGGNVRTVADVEKIACRYPACEWIIRFIEPLQSLVYQRQSAGQWNLVRVGSGMF